MPGKSRGASLRAGVRQGDTRQTSTRTCTKLAGEPYHHLPMGYEASRAQAARRLLEIIPWFDSYPIIRSEQTSGDFAVALPTVRACPSHAFLANLAVNLIDFRPFSMKFAIKFSKKTSCGSISTLPRGIFSLITLPINSGWRADWRHCRLIFGEAAPTTNDARFATANCPFQGILAN